MVKDRVTLALSAITGLVRRYLLYTLSSLNPLVIIQIDPDHQGTRIATNHAPEWSHTVSLLIGLTATVLLLTAIPLLTGQLTDLGDQYVLR